MHLCHMCHLSSVMVIRFMSKSKVKVFPHVGMLLASCHVLVLVHVRGKDDNKDPTTLLMFGSDFKHSIHVR